MLVFVSFLLRASVQQHRINFFLRLVHLLGWHCKHKYGLELSPAVLELMLLLSSMCSISSSFIGFCRILSFPFRLGTELHPNAILCSTDVVGGAAVEHCLLFLVVSVLITLLSRSLNADFFENNLFKRNLLKLVPNVPLMVPLCGWRSL